MKLYLLRPIRNLPKDSDPWSPWYDKCFGMVARAESEEIARSLADKEAGDENRNTLDFSTYPAKEVTKPRNPWLDSLLSTCTELTYDGSQEVIIKDMAYA